MLSILAMDSYNRGYGEGIEGLGGLGYKVGAATISTDSETVSATKDEAQAAGFYAVSYTIGAGVKDLDENSTVISYRGTDNTHDNGEGGNDIWEGWTIGAGDISSWISCVLLQWIQCKNFNVWRAI